LQSSKAGLHAVGQKENVQTQAERIHPCSEVINPRKGQKMEQKDLKAYENLSKRIPAKELSTLLKVSSSLASTMDLTEVLQIAVESGVEMLGLDTGAVYTLENETLLLGATFPPLPPHFPEELRFAHLWDHPHIQEAVTIMSPVYLQDARTASLSAAEKSVVDTRGLVSILYFPLVLKENAIGVFIVGSSRSVRKFSSSEMELSFVLAAQVSLAIANAQLYRKAQDAIVELTRAYDATLAGWSQVLDMRDHVTESIRTASPTSQYPWRAGWGSLNQNWDRSAAGRFFMISARWQSRIRYYRNQMNCLPWRRQSC
jgi:transcriptional regulator with GAF, ATPase, and Fis domain